MFSGIPQGSILGPLLFIIFINDLVDFCDINLKLYLFADDAKLYCYIKDMLDIDYLQRGIDNTENTAEPSFCLSGGWKINFAK